MDKKVNDDIRVADGELGWNCMIKKLLAKIDPERLAELEALEAEEESDDEE